MNKKINKKELGEVFPNANKSSVIKRIKNVQGQLGGISRMIEDEKDCVLVVTQFKAARAGIEKALDVFLEENLRHCMSSSLSEEKRKEVESILRELTK